MITAHLKIIPSIKIPLLLAVAIIAPLLPEPPLAIGAGAAFAVEFPA